jgi:hypothetical protein
VDAAGVASGSDTRSEIRLLFPMSGVVAIASAPWERTTDGKPSSCPTEDGQQDGHCRVLKDKAGEGEGGDVGRHGCNEARLGRCDQRVPA